MNSGKILYRTNSKGQSLLELVIGLGLITIVISALTILTVAGLRNSQFSKNQLQATKLAQEVLEKVRTVKSSNYEVCLAGQGVAGNPCSYWEDIWSVNFGSLPSCTTNCTFVLSSCGAPVHPCLRASAVEGAVGTGSFTGLVTVEDEAVSQKRITSTVYWTDSTGKHSSKIVTIFSKI